MWRSGIGLAQALASGSRLLHLPRPEYPRGAPRLGTAFELLARRKSQFAMVAKVRKQVLSSRIQLLTTRRQLVAIITKHQELVVVVLLKENPSAFRRSNPDADARRNKRLAFTVTCVQDTSTKRAARSHLSFRHEIRKSPGCCGGMWPDRSWYASSEQNSSALAITRTGQRTEQSSQLLDLARERCASGR